MNALGLSPRAVRYLCPVLVLAVALVAGFAEAIEAPEYEVKAAFLYNFAKFVEWPQGTFSSPTAPIQICVLGTNPFGSYLDAVTRGKQVNGRPISIRTGVTPAAAASDCQIVFLSTSVDGQMEAVLARLARAPVLTVGDNQAFASQGGVIGLSMEQHHVRFEINMIAARQARLKLSSQLLKVATQIIGQLNGGG